MFEVKKYLSHCNEVYHTTFDPMGPGCVRIHLVPPKVLKMGIPWVVIINGYSVLPLETSWAILLKEFITSVNSTDGKELSDDQIKDLIDGTIKNVKKVFRKTSAAHIKADLEDIIDVLVNIARGEEPKEDIGYMTLGEYADLMRAPHRVDVMVSSMEKNMEWNCNQKCVHCYAANEKMSSVRELTTNQWKKVIDQLKKACVPAITFTGGEPTMREDLVELVDYSRWFVTRLNTNGILLSRELCDKLYQASLDSVQVTFYSSNKAVHNMLVGGNHFDQTVEGIKNAIAAGLDVSTNTPLCSLNEDFPETLKYLISLGVRYFSCSGLIPTGNAKNTIQALKLSESKMEEILDAAFQICKENNCELSFTSPGWVSPEFLKQRKMVVPSCGACLSNMAVAPNGEVLPCQSWLFEDGLGNLTETTFDKIWDSPACVEKRNKSAKMLNVCQLREVR